LPDVSQCIHLTSRPAIDDAYEAVSRQVETFTPARKTRAD